MKMRTFKDELTKDWYKVGLIGIPIILFAIVAFYIWGDKLIHGGIPCMFFSAFHLYCPGCGGTRSFYYFVHGNIWQSLIHNPFVPYTLVLYSVFMINTFLCRHTKKAGFVGFPITILIYVAIGILFGQWIVRNVIWIVFKITLL